MKRKLAKSFLAVLLLVTMCTQSTVVLADEAGTTWNDPYVYVESYAISHDRIIPGDTFSLTLNLKNYSESRTAHEVMITIENPKGVAPVYGTVSQVYLGDIAPLESREVVFEYDSWTTLTGETLDFVIRLVSISNENKVTLRVPAGTESLFGIMDFNMASEIYENDITTASLSFKVLGNKNVGNIELRTECNGTTIGSSQVGNVNAGVTKTQSISFKFEEAGEYVIDFYLDYVGEDGVRETEFLGSKQITVEKAAESEEPAFSDSPVVEQPENSENVTILVLGGLLILAIFGVAVAIMKKKR